MADGSGSHDGESTFLPFQILQRFRDAAEVLPGGEFVRRQFERAERIVLGELKARLAKLEEPSLRIVPRDPAVAALQAQAAVARRMSALLARAREQTPEQARAQWHRRILEQLCGDELLVLAALAGGGEVPLLHVALGAPVGNAARRIAENLSGLGKAALLKLPEQAPDYVGHLRDLRLLATGPEDKLAGLQYQLLENDSAVRTLVAAAPKGAGNSVRYLRRTVRLSKLGQEFWDGCQER